MEKGDRGDERYGKASQGERNKESSAVYPSKKKKEKLDEG